MPKIISFFAYFRSVNISPMKQVLVLSISVAIFLSCQQSTPDSVGDKESVEMDSIFAALDSKSSPGCAVAVFSGGKVVFSKGYGMANLELGVPITPSSVFDIASVSKQFTAYAIAKLIEEGKLSENDDIREFFPELVDFAHTITIAHLVYHTSGLRDWPQALAIGGWSMEDELTYEQVLRMAFRQTDLNYPPGEEYSYTNTGYVLLAEIVSRVTGHPFHEYIQKSVYEPLEMRNSYFNYDIHTVIPARAQSYYAREGEAGGFITYANTTTAMGSSSMFSTVEDLAKWLMFLATNMESHPVVKRMHFNGVLNNGDTIEYAYGIWTEELGGLPAIAHTGSWSGFRAITVRFPTKDFGLIILSNYGDFDRYKYAGQVAKVFLGDSFQISTEVPLKPSPLVETLEGAEGVYLSNPLRIYELDIEGGLAKLTIDGASELEFNIFAEGQLLSDNSPGSSVTLQGDSLYFGNNTSVKVNPAIPELSRFVGTYYSEELQMVYEIKLSEGVLTVNNIKYEPVVLEPLGGNVFKGSEWFLGRIVFIENDASIDGLCVFGGRVRRLHFKKVNL